MVFFNKFGKNAQKSTDKLQVCSTDEDSSEQRLSRAKRNDEIDNRFDFLRYKDSSERIGWLINIQPTDLLDDDKRLISAVNYYFIQQDGSRFKVALPFKPYLYVLARKDTEREVAAYLSKKYMGIICSVDAIAKEDLDLPNHLTGLKRTYLKLSFIHLNDLMKVKKELYTRVRKNRQKDKTRLVYAEMLTSHLNAAEGGSCAARAGHTVDQLDNIVDMREYDVPYHIRVSIDLKIFVAHWYSVIGHGSDAPEIKRMSDAMDWPDPIVLAFDIETTKLPLKFPDATVDQIMMISYMIDGQGYLITNREIVSSDVEDFEYTPKPDFDGQFTVFNEPDEEAVVRRFFEHIQGVKPHIISTYNGDMFDWPFVEARAKVYNIDMSLEIGVQKDSQGEYKSRQCIHMDCFKWVQRDSYLPVGSQNLKACARAKLRYDPIELDPEEMCKMAVEQPQVLASYSVSDAVATYYLYMKYVHPFIFALCTIIPLEPDGVLRKGSGTLCEALLMVEAFHANVIYPNKQETVLNKMTEDGHVLDSETYVGGHVEALESGIFRADIPCRFRLVPEAFQGLIEGVERTVKHVVEVEEHLSLDEVTNFEEVCDEIKAQLVQLRDCPARLECPIIYHLDVGAMYPNIILTNRLQPPAIVNVSTCAACDFNKPGARCQRDMPWVWRGEIIPATRSEYQRVLQQLEAERFPAAFPGGTQRAFHELSNEEQAAVEKKRLHVYCKKAYKRLHDVKTEKRMTTVCQRENSFYVDTVRAFRDRRYEYKALLKVAKKKLQEALQRGDAEEIKSAKAKEVLYDSLQTAHKCILNSFYGYVMRKGSRWFSMEMAGIVCYTGAQLITNARELIEQIGRPLELDTDGIWCVLPASFPENYVLKTTNSKKPKFTLSYPGAMLNVMVKDRFTNDQFHDLVDKEILKYEVRSENSIFFEVDGPYKAMVLPAAKEEGKRLKKRYAVFNFDGSLAELKGFEVKRRGELELIKIFQTSVFETFLKGSTLDEVYQYAAKCADHWLDVLYSKAAAMPDSELFDLISENKNMSRKLEDYGEQKSTSISTAKRLAEFLGDQMVKDTGLSCRYVIVKKPEGAPVTERAIPLAIFQAEPAVKRHFLRRWLKTPGLGECDIRSILDWDYYVERLSSAVQKIVTIPAAMQGVANPVPRVQHPDWLHKRMLEKTDTLKQKRITEIFAPVARTESDGGAGVEGGSVRQQQNALDIEEIGGSVTASDRVVGSVAVSKRKRIANAEEELLVSWRSLLGEPPKMGKTRAEQLKWLEFQKKKWAHMQCQRSSLRRKQKRAVLQQRFEGIGSAAASGMSGYLRKTAMSLMDAYWQILQVCETSTPGLFVLWVLIGHELHKVNLRVPRIFYVNTNVPKPEATGPTYRKVHKTLPRSNEVKHLYEYRIPEEKFQQHLNDMYAELSVPEIEGFYEVQVPLLFRVLAQLGCVCQVSSEHKKKLGPKTTVSDSFDLDSLEFCSLAVSNYLGTGSVRHIYLYHYAQDSRTMLAVIIPASRKGYVYVVDRAKTNNMPNLSTLYSNTRSQRISAGVDPSTLPKEDHSFEIIAENNIRTAFKGVHKVLQSYKDEKRGPTIVAVQTQNMELLTSSVSVLSELPLVRLHVSEAENLYSTLDWQRVGSRHLLNHYLHVDTYLASYLELCRYFHIPLGNVPKDAPIFGADLFYARNLWRANHVLWCSVTERPDHGGKEIDDNRLVTEFDETVDIHVNERGCYPFVCVEIDIASLPVAAVLQSHNINDQEGVQGAIGFDCVPQMAITDLVGGDSGYQMLASYDDTALCVPAFRWLRSSQSLLYEPAIKKTLYILMKKLLILLLSELKQLGAVIVHASLSRIVLCTKKRRVDDALAYVNFVLKNIQRKDLFGSLDLAVCKSWSLLLWLDAANFGGIRAQCVEEKSQKTQTQSEETEHEEDVVIQSTPLPPSDEQVVDVPEIDLHWNMMYFLPEAGGCQRHFKMIVAGFIGCLYQHLQKELTEKKTCLNSSVLSQMTTNALSQSVADVSLAENTVKNIAEYSRELVAGDITEQLFTIIQKIHKKISSSVTAREGGSSALFPRLPGSHLNLRNPALELAKSVCCVLGLDAYIADQVNKLRRDLLRLIGVGEFSDQAEWRDPCLSYVIPQLICTFCNYCRDLDLCRDHSVLKENAGDIAVWQCCQCSKEYDLNDIERQLISALNRLNMSYTLQDLKCLKCKEVKQRHMNVQCECAANYVNGFSKEEFATKIKTFYNIAIFYKMELLEETLEWIITQNSDIMKLLNISYR